MTARLALSSVDAYEDERRLSVREEATVTSGGAAVRRFLYRARRPPA